VGRRPFLALLIVLNLACAPSERPSETASAPGAAGPVEDGGTLVRRLDTDVATVNPILSMARQDRLVTTYVFTPLIQIDRDLQPVPALADSWEVSEDGLRYRFDLNEKATFSDGRPVRAQDVLFTLRKIVDPASEAVQMLGAFETLDLAQTRVIDDRAIEVVFRQALASQLIRFRDVLVLPEHIYSKGDFRRDFNDRAVGSGPYVLRPRTAAGDIVVERRRDYWGEKPHIDTVVFKIINDQATAYNALKRGDIDETMIGSDTWLRERSNPDLKRRIDFQRFYTLNYNFIAWNTRHRYLGDKRVRRALAMCIPIDAVIQDLYHGTARAMTGPFTPDEWAYNPTVPVIKYDPEGAKRLLASAGWRDTDADGLLDRDGKPFQFSLLIMSGSATGRQVAQMVQSEFRKIGVQLDISVMDGAMAIQRLIAGNYDAGYLSWDLDPDPDPHALFHSSQIPPRGQNLVWYSNPLADQLMDQARRELDQSKRKELYWQLHEVLAEDQPYTWICQVSVKWGVNRRVQNVVASRGYGYFGWTPGELGWWIPRKHQGAHAAPARK
jgi:peptide/nickel transport system substrate-binding protein